MDSWGISLVELSELATIPQITSDGIRLAYENGIAPLDDFTDQFPVDSVGDAFPIQYRAVRTFRWGHYLG